MRAFATMIRAAAGVALRCRLGPVYARLYTCRTFGVAATVIKRDTERSGICHANLRGTTYPPLFLHGAFTTQYKVKDLIYLIGLKVTASVF